MTLRVRPRLGLRILGSLRAIRREPPAPTVAPPNHAVTRSRRRRRRWYVSSGKAGYIGCHRGATWLGIAPRSTRVAAMGPRWDHRPRLRAASDPSGERGQPSDGERGGKASSPPRAAWGPKGRPVRAELASRNQNARSHAPPAFSSACGARLLEPAGHPISRTTEPNDDAGQRTLNGTTGLIGRPRMAAPMKSAGATPAAIARRGAPAR